MGRFHVHADGTEHSHHLDGPDHTHDVEGADVEGGDAARLGDHSGYETGTERVAVLQNILGENDRVAAENRADFERHGIRAVNVMSSPGAGKTTLLRRTIPEISASTSVSIVEGDIATSIDADELRGLGAQVSLVNTSNGFGGECHLDAVMVRSGLDRLDLAATDLLIIENVGNLVCPAEFDVGEAARVMVYSITEGEEKPLKYPVMFRAADVVIINKIDLLPHLDYDLDLFRRNLEGVNPGVAVIELSARTGDGMEAWLAWLRQT